MAFGWMVGLALRQHNDLYPAWREPTSLSIRNSFVATQVVKMIALGMNMFLSMLRCRSQGPKLILASIQRIHFSARGIL